MAAYRISLLALVLALIGACKNDSKPAPREPGPAVAAPARSAKDGTRRIAVEASDKGYLPDRIAGKPNEKLVLVFTRTHDGTCLEQLVLPDRKAIALPLNQPLDVPVTVPASGELTFVCGMDMFRGQIIARP